MSSSARPWNVRIGLASLAEQGERALHGITQDGERDEGNVEQLDRAQREVAGDHPEFVAMGLEPIEQEVDIGRGPQVGLLLGRREHRRRPEVVAQSLVQRGTTGLLKVHEEVAGRLRTAAPLLHRRRVLQGCLVSEQTESPAGT